MELGNLMFGNSRGEYPIPRSQGWEEVLDELFQAIADATEERYSSYGMDYENDTFWTMRYWWGDCTCGWDEVDDGHKALCELEHRPNCYQHEYRRLMDEMGIQTIPDKLSRLAALYKKHGWDIEDEGWWHGCAIRCSCDYHDRHEAVLDDYAGKFGHEGHLPDCKLVRPNFHHKPSGFSLSWYKFPLRDSYCNQDITLAEFEEMVEDCVEGVRKGRGQ